MGKSKSPSLPAAPTFYNDPTATAAIPDLYKYGQEAASGDFSGRLSWLSPTINANNSALALTGAQGLLQPQFRDTLQQISNQAAASGQMESSTFADALARSQSDINSQYQSIVSQQAIRDAELSNQNRLSIFGTGLGTIQNSAQLGLTNQGQKNQFNLSNYENQVSAALAGQKQANGGLLGGLMGAGGGALAGLALAPLTGGSSLMLAGLGAGLGGAAGALTPQSQNVGGSLLGSGAGLLGNSMQTQAISGLGGLLKSGGSAAMPGQFASNLSYAPDAFSNTAPYAVPNLSNPFFSNRSSYLFG